MNKEDWFQNDLVESSPLDLPVVDPQIYYEQNLDSYNIETSTLNVESFPFPEKEDSFYYCPTCKICLDKSIHNFKCTTCKSEKRIQWFCVDCDSYVDAARKSSHSESKTHKKNISKLRKVFITKVVPDSGTSDGGTFLSVHGEALRNCKVIWNNIPINTHICNDDLLHCFSIPGQVGESVSIFIRHPTKGDSNILKFHYNQRS